MMHVVFPLLNMKMSGGLRVTFQYANGLAQRGHQVTVVVPAGENSDYLQLGSGVDWVKVPIEQPKRRRGYVKLVWSLGWHIPACDAIVANSWQTMYPAMLARILTKAKLVFLIQHRDGLVQGRLSGRSVFVRLRNSLGVQIAYRMPALRVAVSSWVADLPIKEFRSPVLVLPNGVDIEQFHPGEGLPLGERDVFWVTVLGRRASWKGYADAVEAIRIARRSEPSIRMLLVTRDSLHVPDDIAHRLVEPNDDEKLRACYCSSDVFLYTSHFEGFGLPPLEAMACGVPVVTTDCGGVRDFARHEDNCLLAPIKQPHALANAILWLLRDEALRRHLARAGRETACCFRKEKAIEGFCKIVESL